MEAKHTYLEYLWLDGSGLTIRSKTMVVEKKIKSVDELSWWTYDGSSCGQATTADSEIWLKPVAMHPDPFRKPNGFLVICENF